MTAEPTTADDALPSKRLLILPLGANILFALLVQAALIKAGGGWAAMYLGFTLVFLAVVRAAGAIAGLLQGAALMTIVGRGWRWPQRKWMAAVIAVGLLSAASYAAVWWNPQTLAASYWPVLAAAFGMGAGLAAHALRRRRDG